MFQNFLFAVFLFCASSAIAQVGITPVKTTEKPAEPQIDYTLIGAPMPPLRYIVYRDTASHKNSTIEVTKTDILVTKKGHSKKEKKHHKEVVLSGVNAEISKPVLTNDDLDYKGNLLVMIFNPNCSHCQDETVMIGKSADLFNKSKLVLIANPVMQMYIGDFIKYTRFEQYPFMYLGIDSSGFTNKVYLYRALPQINVYDKHRKLIKIFSGEVAIDSLKRYIQ